MDNNIFIGGENLMEIGNPSHYTREQARIVSFSNAVMIVEVDRLNTTVFNRFSRRALPFQAIQTVR